MNSDWTGNSQAFQNNKFKNFEEHFLKKLPLRDKSWHLKSRKDFSKSTQVPLTFDINSSF